MKNASSLMVGPILGLCYFLAAAIMVATTRYDNGVAFVWIATAILVPVLCQRDRIDWIIPLAICGVASFLATGLFGLGWAMALPFALINLIEAGIAASLMRRRQLSLVSPFKSLPALMNFILAAGIAAPLVAGLLAATALVFAGHNFLSTFAHFSIGHALGALTFMPVVSLIVSGEMRAILAKISGRKMREIVLILAFVAATVWMVFWIDTLPLLFLPAGPILIAIFRARQIGAALSIILFAAIGGTMTALGHGPVHLASLSPGAEMQLFQLVLAAYVLAALPIAADLENRATLYRELRLSRRRYQMLADHSSDILLHLDVGGHILYASPAMSAIGGFEPDELIGRQSSDLIHPDDLERVRNEHRAALVETGRVHSFDYRGRSSDGQYRWFETRTRAILSRGGKPEGVISVIRDISERKAKEAEWLEAASTDALTGLLNRRSFTERAERLVAGSNGGAMTLALVDLDHFKTINDRYGHAVGDIILEGFAAKALGQLRDIDVMARIGGEEFVILLPGLGPLAAETICETLRETIATSRFFAQGERIALTISGGISPIGPSGLAAAMKEADAALYDAKDKGRNRFVVASQSAAA